MKLRSYYLYFVLLLFCFSSTAEEIDSVDSQPNNTSKNVISPDPLNINNGLSSQNLLNMVPSNGINGVTSSLSNTVSNKLQSSTINTVRTYLEKYFPTVEIMEAVGGSTTTQQGVLVLTPLFINDVKNTLFTQDSVYHYGGNRTVLNMGLGYRRLEIDNKLLLGANSFYDQEFPYNHGRTSLGLEARTSVGEVNFNQYWGTTGWKTVSNGYQERSLGGTDLELGVPLPYINWTKLYVRGFVWYSVDNVGDLKGNDVTLRTELPLVKGLAVELGHRTYNNLPDENFMKITFNAMDLFKQKSTTKWFNDKAFELTSMESKRFDKVRRENIIIKQTRSSNGGFTVSVKGY